MRSFRNRKQITDKGRYVLFPFGVAPPIGFVFEDFAGLKQADQYYWYVTSVCLVILAVLGSLARDGALSIIQFLAIALVVWAIQILVVALVMPGRRFYQTRLHGSLLSKINPRTGAPVTPPSET